jgi:hypothetical protein
LCDRIALSLLMSRDIFFRFNLAQNASQRGSYKPVVQATSCRQGTAPDRIPDQGRGMVYKIGSSGLATKQLRIALGLLLEVGIELSDKPLIRMNNLQQPVNPNPGGLNSCHIASGPGTQPE